MSLSNEDSWLRDALFHTCCTSHGKVCTMFIDSGSFTNGVSEEKVTKLGFKIEPLQKPYNVRWLQNSGGVRVSKWCLVSFSIDKNYKDEIWCDVTPVDACHLLLGRP